MILHGSITEYYDNFNSFLVFGRFAGSFSEGLLDQMYYNKIVLIFIVLLSGCASEPPPQQQLNFSPAGKSFKNAAAHKAAFRIAEAKCKAYGMQVAASATAPTMQRPSYVNIQTAPVFMAGSTPLPTPYSPDASGAIAAHQAGDATRFSNELATSSAMSCMAQEGWVLD
jgi:hypothetical protein